MKRQRRNSLKRPFDFLLATLGLILFSPIWILISVLIKLDDGGPIFYTQERWAREGKKFVAYKFRTMVPHSDEKWGSLQARANDPRLTKVGRVLRGTALDELPQLINIWKGDMSFVGPRALAVTEIPIHPDGEAISFQGSSEFRQRLQVHPGLTGLAQIYAPRDASFRKKFRYDLLYINDQSLRLDIRLIVCSVWISLHAKWESGGRKI